MKKSNYSSIETIINIAKKGGSLRKSRGDRQTHFGTFDFWVEPGF